MTNQFNYLISESEPGHSGGSDTARDGQPGVAGSVEGRRCNISP